MVGKRHKYNAKSIAVDGHNFASVKESKRYVELRNMKADGLISNLELQPRFSWKTIYEANGRSMENNRYHYRADFRYLDGDGKVIVEDVKGWRTKEYLRKKKIVECLYDLQIVEI
jgi:predicted nuclease of restriction endonuclease-like RecB superfamily